MTDVPQPEGLASQNPSPEREPLPGEQYPAATLTQTGDPIAAQPSSGPFPAQAPPAQLPAPPRKPRNKPAVVFAIIAGLFVVATGVLGTLFIMEQGDHRRTSGALTALRGELDSAKQSATHAADELKRKTARIDEMEVCVSSTLKFLNARTEQEAETLFDDLYDNC